MTENRVSRSQYLKYPRRDRFDYKPYSVNWEWPKFRSFEACNMWFQVGTQVDSGAITHEAIDGRIVLPWVDLFGRVNLVTTVVADGMQLSDELHLTLSGLVPTLSCTLAVAEDTQKTIETTLSVPAVPTFTITTDVV
jgi:hypothetical protein